MQIVVNDLLTTYNRQGKGKVVLLLHGWGDTADGLGKLQAKLSSDYDVIAVNLPGFGGTQAPDIPWGLDAYASFVHDFCKKLGVDAWAIAGHSNGGAIAIRGIANGSLQAEKLVLLASAGVRGEYKGRVFALRLIAKTGKLLTMPLPKRIKRKLQKKVYKTVGSDMLVAEHMQETFKRVVTDDVRHDAARLDVDTLLIYGENDTATPPQWGEKLHRNIKGSKIQILPSTGHFVHVDQLAMVVDLMKGFLR